jgi:hypothetical protein
MAVALLDPAAWDRGRVERRFAAAVDGTSMVGCNLQNTVNVLGHGLDLAASTASPSDTPCHCPLHLRVQILWPHASRLVPRRRDPPPRPSH